MGCRLSGLKQTYNFTKNVEYAMICRKPNAVLARAQTSTIFSAPSGTTARDFNHPFAKPPDVWRWIFSATCIKGQNFYDPFLGAGSSAVAGLDWGLKPMGSEIDEGNYANALMNLQAAYKKLLGGNVTFS
jgi:DNA modification methylase